MIIILRFNLKKKQLQLQHQNISSLSDQGICVSLSNYAFKKQKTSGVIPNKSQSAKVTLQQRYELLSIIYLYVLIIYSIVRVTRTSDTLISSYMALRLTLIYFIKHVCVIQEENHLQIEQIRRKSHRLPIENGNKQQRKLITKKRNFVTYVGEVAAYYHSADIRSFFFNHSLPHVRSS